MQDCSLRQISFHSLWERIQECFWRHQNKPTNPSSLRAHRQMHRIWQQHCGTTVETPPQTRQTTVHNNKTVCILTHTHTHTRTAALESEAWRLRLRPDPHLATTSVQLLSIWPEAEAEMGPAAVWPTSVWATPIKSIHTGVGHILHSKKNVGNLNELFKTRFWDKTMESWLWENEQHADWNG